jgi:hypothetical protein
LFEQSGHAAVLAVPVLFAAFGDEGAGVLVGDDGVGVEGGGAEDADGVVVAEDEVADGFVGVFAECGEPVVCGGGGGSGFEGDEEVLAFDGADVGVAFGGEGVDAVGEGFEGFGLVGEVG